MIIGVSYVVAAAAFSSLAGFDWVACQLRKRRLEWLEMKRIHAHVREMESTPSLGEKYFKYVNINWTEIQLTDDEEGQWERYIEDEYGVTQVTWGDRNWGETKWSVPIDGGWLSRLCQSDQKARDLRSRACKLLKTHAPNKVPSHKKDLRQLGI